MPRRASQHASRLRHLPLSSVRQCRAFQCRAFQCRAFQCRAFRIKLDLKKSPPVYNHRLRGGNRRTRRNCVMSSSSGSAVAAASLVSYTYDEVMTLRSSCVAARATSMLPHHQSALHQVCQQMEQRLSVLKQRRRKKRGSTSGGGWKGAAVGSDGAGGGGVHQPGAPRGMRGGANAGKGHGGRSMKPPPRPVASVSKQLVLALNSVTDKNVDAVCAKIKSIASKDPTVFHEHGTQLVDQLVDNAVMQPIYADVYVQIINFMINETLCERAKIVPMVLARCDGRQEGILQAKLSKIVCRGIGWMYAHLFLQHLIDFDTLCNTVLALCQILSTTSDTGAQEQACEAVTCIVLKVGESTHGASTAKCRKQWDGPVLKQLCALWDSERLNIRVRVRMFDLKDAFGM